MARRDTLDFEILGSILHISVSGVQFGQMLGMTHSCEFENFSGQVFENCCDIDRCLGSNAHLVLGVVLQEALDTAARKLNKRLLANVNTRNAQRAHEVNGRAVEEFR